MSSNKKEVLLKEMSSEFPITESDVTFKELYPFCNELGYAEISFIN